MRIVAGAILLTLLWYCVTYKPKRPYDFPAYCPAPKITMDGAWDEVSSFTPCSIAKRSADI